MTTTNHTQPGRAIPAAPAQYAPVGAPTTPSSTELLDALYRLTVAAACGHIRYAEGSRGHAEAAAAINEARRVLLRSNRYSGDPALVGFDQEARRIADANGVVMP